jgi:hypothetical protein
MIDLLIENHSGWIAPHGRDHAVDGTVSSIPIAGHSESVDNRSRDRC